MSISMTKTLQSFCFKSSSFNHDHGESFANPRHVFVSKKPSSRTGFVLRKPCKSPNALLSLSKTLDHPITDANAQIYGFCKVRDLEKSIELLHEYQKSEIDSRTYCSILQLCADLKSLKHGKEVHSIIRANGVIIRGVLGSKLVFMYVTCGDLKEGRLIFDEIKNDKVFLWNFMMNEYAKIGSFRESVYLFKQMLKMGIEADSYTFSCVLKCLGNLGSVKEGEQVHGYSVKLGFGDYNSVVNALIAFYSKNRKVESAGKLFDELTERDVVSWNTMINGYITNSFPKKGLEVFRQMLVSNIDADLATMITVLTGCTDCGMLSLGRAVHGYAIKARLSGDITFNNTLLDMYSKCGELNVSVRVFDQMGKRSVVSWTSMIAGYTREGLLDEAVKAFHEMEKEGITPDLFTVTVLLNACARNGSLQIGKRVHDYIKQNDMESNLFVSNALMDMYAKCGTMEEAQTVFNQTRVKDVVSWNTMIGGFSKNCLPNEALNLFAAMIHESEPDGRTMACILPACASIAALERGREIHGRILRNECFSDQHVVNALVDMYAKCGALFLARLLFDMIPSKDLISWTVMIAGYGMHGFGREAITIFNDMRNSGIEPDEVSFVSILYSCSHSGLLEEGWRFFNIMRNDYKIEPKLEHYACMVDLLSRSGKLSKAYKFIETMPIAPDATIWGALLFGCRSHHDVTLAEKVAERVFELEPENTGYYVLLANIYAEAEKWEEVKKLRQRIGQRGLRKNPGCSWIEVKGKVNIFLARDDSHPQSEKIVSLLKTLRTKMKEEGNFARTKYALINGDEMEKEIALCGHSEKLAMAFGILSSGPGKIIRVTKNLRVCGDCHEMAKFMSKTTRREIVLRDSNRFHHFKDGYCSCRGFW